MSRLSAGGRVVACRRSTPPNCAHRNCVRPNCAYPPKRLAREPARRYRFGSICPRAVGIALALWAAAVPAHATGGDAPAPTRTEARTVVGFAAPLVPLAGSDKARDGRAMERPAKWSKERATGRPTGQDAHWTLRSPVYVRTSAGEAVGSASGQAEGAGRGAGMRTADVAMFSWKEIAAVGLVLAFVLGALLALTGGGARGPSGRPSRDG